MEFCFGTKDEATQFINALLQSKERNFDKTEYLVEIDNEDRVAILGKIDRNAGYSKYNIVHAIDLDTNQILEIK